MNDLVLPTIGSSGYFEVRSPIDAVMMPNERYTCQAIRRLNDYISNNEEPKEEIYALYGLSEEEYEADVEKNNYIVSLQSELGHWVYVPAQYLLKYPIVNGIPYRTMMLGVSLPALPAEKNLSFLIQDITNLISDTLGVATVIKPVETSRVVLVSKEKHDITEAARRVVSSGKVTDRSRYTSLLIDHQAALDKIQKLEAYILSRR
jgi:hypothetical protein